LCKRHGRVMGLQVAMSNDGIVVTGETNLKE
jgi:hypothetical protein